MTTCKGIDNLVPFGNDFCLAVTLKSRSLVDGKVVETPFDFEAADTYNARIYGILDGATLSTMVGLKDGSTDTVVVDAKGVPLIRAIGVEVTGEVDGRAFRAAEKGFISIVEFNGEAKVVFTPVTGGQEANLVMTLTFLPSAAVVGKNAYEIWKEEPGNQDKTLADFIYFLGHGESAYEIAVRYGYTGTEAEYNMLYFDAVDVANTAGQNAQQAADTANEMAAQAQDAAELADAATANANNAATAAAATVDAAINNMEDTLNAAIAAQDAEIEEQFATQTALINQKQMEIGAVPSDLSPTIGSTNWVTSGGLHDSFDSVWNVIGRQSGTEQIVLSWQQGALIEGVESSNDARIRTSGYLNLSNYPNGIHIEASEGSFAVFTFSAPDSSHYTSATSWLTQTDITTSSNYIRIVAKNAAGTNITPSFGANISASTTIQATDGLIGAVAELEETKLDGNGKIETGVNPLLSLGRENYTFTAMLSIDANGALQVISTANNNLGNATSNMIDVVDLTLTPNSDNVIFKVVYYNSSGGFISATPYMARVANTYVTSDNVVSSYTITNARCRIVLAYTTLQYAARDAETLVARIDFSGTSASTVDKYKLMPCGDYPIFTSDFRSFVNVRKVNGKWEADFNPFDQILPTSTTAYISPNGVDTNSGKSPLSPVQTVGKALTVGDTIVFLGGTYTAGTHFANGVDITGKNLVANGAVTIDCNGGAPFHITGDCYIEGITFVNGNDGSLNVELSLTSNVVCLNSCEFNQSVGASFGGLVAEGGTLYVYKCKANDNIKDGFNYHKTSGNVIPHVTEIECEAWSNGNADSYTSNNGTTAHDGAQVLRVGGNYGYCKGGILADVNSGTLSVNYGCKVLSSSLTTTDAQYQASVFCGSGAVIWLVDCTLSGSTYAISSINTGSVVHTNKTYANTYTASSGSIVSFTI